MEITPRLKAVAGVRAENSDQDFTQRAGNVASPQNRTAVTPRVGLIYDLAPSVSAYASVGRSFLPNRGGDAFGRSFAPEERIAYEVGTKLDLLDGRLGVTAALFQIEKENVQTADPASTGFNIAAGEARSRGFDASVAGELAPS